MISCKDYLAHYRLPHQSLPRLHPHSLLGIRCSASPSSARERRKERNERRAQQTVSWREEVEEKQAEKRKPPPKGLKYELDMSRLTARGMQWWMVLVSIRSELEVAEALTSALSNEFPDEDFEVYVPSIPTKRKMKDGSISAATRRLHAGCVFLRCVLTRRIHDTVKRTPRVRGFFGKRVGFYEQVIMPNPVPVEDIEGMRRKVIEEELDLERLKELTKEEKNAKRAEIEAVTEKDPTLTVGMDIKVLNGQYANFEGCITGLPDENKEVEASLMAFGEVQDVVLALDEIEVLPKSR